MLHWHCTGGFHLRLQMAALREAGDGDEETKHDKLVFAVDTEEERDVSALPLLSLTALQCSVCPRPASPYIQPIER